MINKPSPAEQGPSPGRRARRKERTRRALLDAALKLFTERGIGGTRLEDLTAEADLGKGAFYNYYESKDALVADLLAEGFDRLDRDYLGPADAARELPARIEAIVRAHLDFFDSHPEYLLLVHHARGLFSPGRKTSDRLSRVFSDYLAHLGELMPPPDRRHEWADEDRRDLAAALAGAIAGYRSFGQAVGMQPRVSTIRDLLAHGLSPQFEARRRPGGTGLEGNAPVLG